MERCRWGGVSFTSADVPRVVMSLVPIRHLGDRQVVLDDTDPNITYIGDEWVTSTGTAQQNFGSLGPVHNNTLHQISKTPGASIKFQFSGESCIVDVQLSSLVLMGLFRNRSSDLRIVGWQGAPLMEVLHRRSTV